MESFGRNLVVAAVWESRKEFDSSQFAFSHFFRLGIGEREFK
jgi:hypothetical protein